MTFAALRALLVPFSNSRKATEDKFPNVPKSFHNWAVPGTANFPFVAANRQVSKKKYRPGPKPADAPLQVPGSVQLDVKFVPRIEKRFHNKKDLTRKLKRWEKEYNEDRPHLALKGKTPAERVCELAQPSEPVKDLS